ncbi:transporter substrate-binding domain-containing protein [Pseudomaricurvus alkylphenolicus]|uniref:transporter substrate-binding domain-containing protein n=1 Tax=Pseudomaricurvus alkylphenolicus TaxID=1306991 RepID=UPI00141E0B93|nr:transporter substrate-binding domain-containing protein [Pseudomaricurvus alkylphenolicus]
MKYRSTTLALMLPLLLPALLYANVSPPQPVKIFGYELEFRLVKEGNTQYNLLFSSLRERGLTFELAVMPFTRILRDVQSHQHCIFPASLNAIKTAKPVYRDLALIASDPVDHISLRVFTRRDSPKISDLSELNGKRIALWGGLSEDIFLGDIDAKIETTPDELIRLRMLDKGRIDAILGFTPDVSLAAEKLGIRPPHYDETLALFHDEGASVVCHDTPPNRQFLDQFNQILSELKTSGELRQILGEHAELTR